MYYEVPLYWTATGFNVPSSGDLGEGWAMDSDLIQEAANGYPVEEISENDLPAPLNNSTFGGLRIFKMNGQDGASYFGIVEQ